MSESQDQNQLADQQAPSEDDVQLDVDMQVESDGAEGAKSADQPADSPADPEQPQEPAAAASDESAESPEQTEQTEQDDQGLEEDEPLITPGMNWFVLRVASNKEDTVRETLLRKIKIEDYEHLVKRILVPTEKQKTIKGGKQKIAEKKLYPGYVFVEMKLEDDGRIPQDVFFLIKETTGVGDFIGTAGRPSPMSLPEIEKIHMASKPAEETPTVQMDFMAGDHIKIKEGPFENMEGTVDELMPDQGKVRVIVTIFGRATPLELEYWQIEKSDEA